MAYRDWAASYANKSVDVLDIYAKACKDSCDTRVCCAACLVAALQVAGAAVRWRLLRSRRGNRKDSERCKESSREL